MKFNPGEIVRTKSVADLSENNQEFALHVNLSLQRHLEGDWGEVPDEDRVQNEEGLKTDLEGFMSVYKKEELETIWIITDYGREVTTVLFPSEY